MIGHFYKFKGGSYIQTDNIDFIKKVTKSELMKIADLRHPVLNKKEYYEVLSRRKDIHEKDRVSFDLMTSTHLVIIYF